MFGISSEPRAKLTVGYSLPALVFELHPTKGVAFEVTLDMKTLTVMSHFLMKTISCI